MTRWLLYLVVSQVLFWGILAAFWYWASVGFWAYLTAGLAVLGAYYAVHGISGKRTG